MYKDVKVDPTIDLSSSPDENITVEESGRNEDSDYLSDRSETNTDSKGRNQQSQPEKINFNISSSETNPDAKGGNQQSLPEKILTTSGRKEELNQTVALHDHGGRSQSRKVLDEKLKEMKDQLIRARAYLNFAQPDSNSHLLKELRLRIKELERAVGDATKDSDLSKRALQRMRGMEITLLKARRIYGDCSTMTKKLRAMTSNVEEQIRTQKNEATFLVKLAGRTTPKGLHCLSMRLTAEYFALKPEDREFPSHQQLHDPDLYHFVVFSDNVLACAAVVDSTISTAMEPDRIVFHVVTDSLNFAAISMWFLLNPPGKATPQIHSMDNFNWLSSKYEAAVTQGHDSLDPRYTSLLNHLRFYLPDIFPMLDKVVLLDHDVVVQRDLAALWNVDMKGKVNGAVETCHREEPSFRRLDMLINFSDPFVARRFNAKACTWAFGVNVFDLKEWRRRNLTGVYLKYLQMGNKRPLWKAGSLPIGLVTFYNQTTALDRRWHVYGLGYHTGVREEDIEQAAILHYDGVMKPWLDIGLDKYKKYWTKHVKFDHPYLQQCNIHE